MAGTQRNKQAGKTDKDNDECFYCAIEYVGGKFGVECGKSTQDIELFLSKIPEGIVLSSKTFKTEEDAINHNQELNAANEKRLQEEAEKVAAEKKRDAEDNTDDDESIKKPKFSAGFGLASSLIVASVEKPKTVSPNKVPSSVFRFTQLVKNRTKSRFIEMPLKVFSPPKFENQPDPLACLVVFSLWETTLKRTYWGHNPFQWSELCAYLHTVPEDEFQFCEVTKTIKYFTFRDPIDPTEPEKEYRTLINPKDKNRTPYWMKILGNFFFMKYGASDEDILKVMGYIIEDMTSKFCMVSYNEVVSGIAMKKETEPGDEDMNKPRGDYWDILVDSFKKVKTVKRETSLDTTFLKSFIEENGPKLYRDGFDFKKLSAVERTALDKFFYGTSISAGVHLSYF